MFQIEDNIPLPAPEEAAPNSKWNKYPFLEMHPGQSTLITDREYTTIRQNANEARKILHRRGEANPKFVLKKEADGIRVWRAS